MKLPFAVTLGPGSSRADLTGSWRTERPVYRSLTAPCGNACPAGRGRPDLALRRRERRRRATSRPGARSWRSTRSRRSCGRVCYHPCETACNRGNLDEAVGINSVERFLGDQALERRAGRVTVTAAAHRSAGAGRRLRAGRTVRGLPPGAASGHEVTIRDSAPHAGGMMRYGIPRYRLPREVLDAEIDRLLALGVALELDTPGHRPGRESRDEGWDAVFLAVGAQLGHRTYLPAASAAHVVDAVSLLHGLEEGERPLLGRRVAVYGGGNTAVDAARTARRLGASDAVVVYRRTRERMPAHDEEVTQAEEEGVEFHWLSTIDRVDARRAAHRADGARRERLPAAHRPHRAAGRRLAWSSRSARTPTSRCWATRQRVPGLATARSRPTGLLATSLPGVFAGGDVVAGERSVTIAIGHGRRVAESIDDWLAGQAPAPPRGRSTSRRTRR